MKKLLLAFLTLCSAWSCEELHAQAQVTGNTVKAIQLLVLPDGTIIGVNTGTMTISQAWQVFVGGTGATSFTSGGIIFGQGTGPLGVSAAPAGQSQIFTSGSSTTPNWSNATVNTAGDMIVRTLTIGVNGGEFKYASGVYQFNENFEFVSSVQFLSGILGEAGAAPASSGQIGEQVHAEVGDTTTSISFGVVTNAFGTSTACFTLSPGDWDIGGVAYVATTSSTVTQIVASISTTTASNTPTNGTMALPFNLSSLSAHIKIPIPTRQVLISTNTPYYLNISVAGSGTATIGGAAWARRSANAQ